MKYKPQNKEQLKKLVDDENIYLGDIDTSLIDNMSSLFANSKREDFSGIENWNVSNVESMAFMFYNAINFNQLLNNWDVSRVIDMAFMFYNAINFNQPLNNWDVSRVGDMGKIFKNANSFNQDISNWNLDGIRGIDQMYDGAINSNKRFKHLKFKNK